jgi:hypothetical protein
MCLAPRIHQLFFDGDTWRWFWQLLLYIPLVGIGCAIIVGPFFALASAAGWLPPPMGTEQGWLGLLTLSILRYLLLFVAFLFSTQFAQRWLRHSSLNELGLRFHRLGITEFLLGCGLGGLLISLSIVLSASLGWYHILGFAWQFRPASVIAPALLRSFWPNAQAGLLEEVVFRGYLLQVLEKRWGTLGAVGASSALFALAHLANAEQDYPSWMVFFSLTGAGIVFAQAYLLKRSLWLPIGLHFAYDWLIVLLGEVGQAPAEAVVLATRASGPSLLQGPRFAGLGVFDLVGAAVVILILWLIGKQRPHAAAI